MKPHLTEVIGLMVCIPLEEQPDIVCGIRFEICRIFLGYKGNVGILLFEQFCKFLRHCAIELTLMLLLKTLHIAEPRNGVTQRSFGKLDQHFFPGKIHIMLENRLAQIGSAVDFQTETQIELFDTLNHTPRLNIHGVQKIASVKIGKNTSVITA